ncbi:hypothetical protein RB620_26695 [Paenibacillus sp. LHD-117]|uniref:hypothetical protein n=1 Tax=Paenibacillus sp. LHD-117 TaxID=3071412 RepID=UPI0027DF30BE|nr:hypothetical protein [Paenibacillus sp. LHD-117]MDQ6423022.1 hypothetical protein [Paenibacillus sp. LHD-117]
MEMIRIPLEALRISYGEHASRSLAFGKAELVVVTDYGDRHWYVDAEGIGDEELLRWFGRSEDIRVDVEATDRNGRMLTGTGYLHPNEYHLAAAIRGDGELAGL